MMDKVSKSNLKEKKDNIYIIYTILFCVISFGVFLAFIKYDRSFIWEGDGIKQHFIILYDFNQIVRNIFKDGIQMMSWNMGLGLDVIGQYSYYVIGDPFAYLSLLFSMENLEKAYNFLVLLRIYFVGLAFIAYCKYNKKETINTIIGAIIYAFCGFILFAGVRHPYFTNAAIFLPLTLIGTEKLLKENKKVFFIFIIFLSALSNYYFFYMITVINVIYGTIKYYFQYNEGIKKFVKLIGNVILCYIIGLLMASVVLLPTVYAFFNSARTESVQVTTYINNFYKYLFMGIVTMRFKNWAVIGVSSIVLIMIPILFTKIKENKEAKCFFTLFLVTTIMLLIPQVASMMNGFSFPSNRWVFAYSFILAYIVTICYDSKFKFSNKQKSYMITMLVIYTLIGVFVTRFNIKNNLDFYAVITISYIIYIIISYKYKKENKFKFANYIVILFIILNIFVISASLYFPRGKGYVKEFIENGKVLETCSNENGKIENLKEAIEYIKQNDKDFYRIAKKDITYQNLSLLYEYNPIQLYLSLGNKNVYELSCCLDDTCYSATRCVNGADRRTKYTTLLGTKYYICSNEDSRYVPYGYNLYYKIGNTLIYINENFLSVGIIYDSYITKEQFNSLSALEKEDALLSTAMIENTKDIKIKNEDTKIDIPKKLIYKVIGNKINNNEIKTTKKDDKVELVIDDIPENSELYLSIKNLKYVSKDNNTDFKVTAKIDGIKNSEKLLNQISSAYYMDNPNFLMNLGVTIKNQSRSLKITFDKKGTYTFDELEILAVDMNKYENKVNKLKANVLDNIKYGNNYISGTVNTNINGILQIATSYSNGWKVFVDGNEQEVIKVNEAFIGTKIEAGYHIIEFKYETPYLKLGIIFSIIGLIVYIGLIILDTKRRENI